MNKVKINKLPKGNGNLPANLLPIGSVILLDEHYLLKVYNGWISLSNPRQTFSGNLYDWRDYELIPNGTEFIITFNQE